MPRPARSDSGRRLYEEADLAVVRRQLREHPMLDLRPVLSASGTGLAWVALREGAPIARSLGASKLFPPMLIHLIASGETSGELEAMLERAADNQERELDGVVNTAVGILGPLMILVMGAFVFVIVIALLLPIFELNQLVR